VVKRYFVRTRDLQTGMRIDQDIQNSWGRSLIVRGSYLDEYQIEALKKLNINGVYIKEGEDDEDLSASAEPVSAIARNNIAKYREADPAKVSLSVSVKKRISEGVQHLYSDTNNPHFTRTTTTITSDLMRAIDDSEAIAVDISALRTSDEYTFKHSVDVDAVFGGNFRRFHGGDADDVLDLVLDDKDHGLKAGAAGVVEGIVHNDLSVGAHRVDLLHAAVAAAHAGCHDDQYRFVHLHFLLYLPGVPAL